jgi:AraC-like DNA-binding protein
MSASPVRLGDLSVGFLHALQPRARLSIPCYMHLGHSAIRQSKEPALGLLMAGFAQLEPLGLAGITAAQAPTVREAARTLTRFEALYASNYRGHSSLHETQQGAWMRFHSIGPYNDYNRFVVDFMLAGWLQQFTRLIGQPLRAQRVQIEFPAPPYADRYPPLFGCNIEFGAAFNQMWLTQASLNKRNPQHCPGTWQELWQLCEHALQQLTRTRSLREKVSQLLGPRLHGREPEMADIARQLGMPAWTMRRRLAEEGTSFASILNETRRDLACSYVRDTELSFGEIAYLLGFASAEAFQRAFKRWLGQTPGALRRNHKLTLQQPEGL